MLLYSGLAVVIAYVHQLTIFMVVPIFNSLARIDKRAMEAALDAGASRFDVMRYIIIPMSKSGIALGSTFVISIVMGDFFVVKVMSGGGSASVVSAFYENVGVLQYPIAAASAVLLTLVLIAMIVVDPARRRYPPGDHAMTVVSRRGRYAHDQNPASFPRSRAATAVPGPSTCWPRSSPSTSPRSTGR